MGDLWNCFADHHGDALTKRGGAHGTTLTSATHEDVNDGVFDLEQLGGPTMRRKRGVNALFQKLLQLLGNSATEFDLVTVERVGAIWVTDN